MSNKLFPKVTQIEGGASSVTTPEFEMTENSAVVFLISGHETPLTVTATGYKDEGIEKAIGFETKALTGTDWTEVESDGVEITAEDAFLVAVPAPFLAHDGLDRVALTIDGGTDSAAIFAFEIKSRYIPE